MRVKNFFSYWLPAIVWAGLIFAASSIPSVKLPNLPILSVDKVIHFSVFLIFGILVYRALGSNETRRGFTWRSALITILVVIMYGVLDEFHQHYVPGRSTDVWDAVADTIGGVVAVLLVYILHRRCSQGARVPS